MTYCRKSSPENDNDRLPFASTEPTTEHPSTDEDAPVIVQPSPDPVALYVAFEFEVNLVGIL